MSTQKSTVYLEPKIHKAVSDIALSSNTSVSKLINNVLFRVITENQEDLKYFDDRENEPNISYSEIEKNLKQQKTAKNIFQEIADQGGFGIKNPIEWQRDIRDDKPLHPR